MPTKNEKVAVSADDLEAEKNPERASSNTRY